MAGAVVGPGSQGLLPLRGTPHPALCDDCSDRSHSIVPTAAFLVCRYHFDGALLPFTAVTVVVAEWAVRHV